MSSQFSFDSYWQRLFSTVMRVASPCFPAGWSSPQAQSPWFVEPDLSLRPGCGTPQAPILLIAAPGAVGKSTLAVNMCARTGLVLVDLAKSDTVGGNFLTGGLMQAGPQALSAWTGRTLGLAIDALDEARLRVTQQSFDDFLKDVVTVSRQNTIPIVLFGRTGMVDECWLWFQENGLDAAIFDIELFDEQRAIRFVESNLKRRAKEMPQDTTDLAEHIVRFSEPYRQAATSFVQRLADVSHQSRQVEQKALEFAGYAPVLEAIGGMLARTRNPASLVADALKVHSKSVLFQVVDLILVREQSKLRENLAPAFGSVPVDALYQPEEQRRRLAAHLFNLTPPPTPHQVPPQLQQGYEDAVESFLAQHPFLDGTGVNVSSAVFSADLIAFALHHDGSDLRRAGEDWAQRDNRAPNPFLIDFYVERGHRVAQELLFIAPEHVGLLDSSVRARLRARQHATLEFSQEDDGDGSTLVLEIVRSSGEVEARVEGWPFRSSAAGTVRLKHKVSRVTIQAEDLDLELGDGQTCELAAPVLVDVCNLRFFARDVLISREASPGADVVSHGDAVAIFAKKADTSSVTKLPRVADGVVLRVNWPGVAAFPWNHFVSSSHVAEDPSLAEAQRALRRLVVSFRSHSKGQLARFKDKIESRRMTKGEIGERIREALLADGILSISGEFYFLDPNALGLKLSTDYSSLRDKVFSEDTNAYLRKLLP